MQNNTMPIQNDEIDLRELWATLVKRKLAVLTVTMITTISSAVYAWMATPIYGGEVLIEVGSVILNSDSMNDKPTIIQSLDSAGDLKEIILQTMNTHTSKKETITVDSPKGSASLIKISYEGSDKQKIIKKLEESSVLVLNRHQNKATFYQQANAKIRPSIIVGAINVNPNPIEPKKQLIVAIGLVGGLIMGVFLAFIIEFIQNGKTRREA